MKQYRYRSRSTTLVWIVVLIGATAATLYLAVTNESPWQINGVEVKPMFASVLFGMIGLMMGAIATIGGYFWWRGFTTPRVLTVADDYLLLPGKLHEPRIEFAKVSVARSLDCMGSRTLYLECEGQQYNIDECLLPNGAYDEIASHVRQRVPDFSIGGVV